jgi:hypothetical protein
MIHQTFLNRDVVRCEQADAVFEHEHGKLREFSNEIHQSLRMYDPRVAQLAEVLSGKTPVNPIHAGKPKEKTEIQGFHFVCIEPNEWRCERTNCPVILHAGTDLEDAKLILGKIKRIERKVLARATITGPIEFHIGMPQWPTHHHVATAITELTRARVILFQTKSGGHVMAAKVEQAAGIPAENILLHEVAHTLEITLQDHRENLRQTLHDDLRDAADILTIISPHYLGIQMPAILKELADLRELKNAGAKTITLQKKSGPDTVRLNPYLMEKIRYLTEEVFAEAIRHFYMEPCMTGKIPSTPVTGWDAFDLLTATMREEAEKTIQRPMEPSSGKFPENLPKIHGIPPEGQIT